MSDENPRYSQFSLDFYRERASEYAALRQVFANRSHSQFREDRDLYRRLAELASAGPGLDAGCGPGALEMSYSIGAGVPDVRAGRGGGEHRSRPQPAPGVRRPPMGYGHPGASAFRRRQLRGRTMQRRNPAHSPRGSVRPGASRARPGAPSGRSLATDVQAGPRCRYGS